MCRCGARTRACRLVSDPALVSRRDFHVLAVLGYRTSSDVDALTLEQHGDLFVGERFRAVLILDHLLHLALQQQQRSTAAGGTLHGFREEIAQLENTLRRMHILAGHGAADGRRMYADFFGDFLDHHRLQLIKSLRQELGLAPHDRLANFQDGLLPLLDILHELDSRGVALANIVAHFFRGALVAIEHFPVLRVQAELRHILIIHLDDVIVAILDEINVGLHHAGARAGIPQAGTWIEVLDHADGNFDVLHRPSESLGNFLVLSGFEQAELVGNDLPGYAALSVDALNLKQKTFAEVARADPG